MITLRCIVDDTTMPESTLLGEHGVAFSVETPDGNLLFDTGQSGDVLAHNSAQLGIDLHQMDALALSHAHYDHTGGLRTFLQQSQPGLPLYAHSDLFRKRYAIKDGKPRSIGLRIAQTDLEKLSALHLSAKPVEIFRRVWTTGEITARTEFEGRSPYHYVRANKSWLPDPYRDDMALILEVQSGLVIICGCCHAGLLNTLAHVRRIFNEKVVAIAGGTHLANLDKVTLEHTITVVRATSAGCLPELYLNHCTGERALDALSQAFIKKVNPCPAGTALLFK